MSKRFNRREFQQQVLDKLQAQASGDVQISTLGVQIGQDSWLVEMSDLSEILPIPPLTPVPLTKSWYCGVSNVRGNLCSIVDLSSYMNNGATSRDARNRVLILAAHFAFNTGVLVSQVLGLRDIHEWQQKEINGRTCYQDGDDHIWYKLDIVQLLQQPEFLQIGI